MTKIVSKGTVISQTVGAGLVPVAQVISMSQTGAAGETFECDTLDNALAEIPYQSTGRSEGGSVSGELFLDPALASHQYITDDITTPPTTRPWSVTYADTATTEWTFDVAGVGLDVTVALADGLKASFDLKLSGLPDYASDATTTTS